MKTLATAVAVLSVSVPAWANEEAAGDATERTQHVIELSEEQMDGVVAGSYWDAGFVTLDVYDPAIRSDPGVGIVKSG